MKMTTEARTCSRWHAASSSLEALRANTLELTGVSSEMLLLRARMRRGAVVKATLKRIMVGGRDTCTRLARTILGLVAERQSAAVPWVGSAGI
jgi:hypothetical protein